MQGIFVGHVHSRTIPDKYPRTPSPTRRLVTLMMKRMTTVIPPHTRAARASSLDFLEADLETSEFPDLNDKFTCDNNDT